MEPLVKCEGKKECTGDQCTFYEPTNELVHVSIQNSCPSEECRIAEDKVKIEYNEIEFKEEISSTYFNSEYNEYKTITEPKVLITNTIKIAAQNTYPYEEYNIESSAVDSLKTPISCHGISEAFTKSNGEKARWHTQKKSDSSELCTKKDPERNNLKTHQAREKFAFPQNCPLELHMSTGTRDKSSPDVSSKTFSEKCSVKRHNVAPRGEEKPFSCDVCTKAFTQKSNLNTHMLIHTGEKCFSCDVCTKAFTQKSNLKAHILIHTGENSFSCDVCGKAFIRKCDMKMHMLIHTGEKPFSCDVCTKAFTQKGTLKRHMLTHTGEKSFSCDICTKAFTRKCDMKGHMLIHTGEKPFSCDICAKAFNHRGNLKTHMFTHTGDKFFSCDICAKAFTQKGRRCSRYQFECHSSGECIAIYNACDGIPQCSDGSDEALELDCPDLGTTQPPVPTVAGAMINKDMNGQHQQQVINPAVRNQQYNSAAQTFRQQPNWQPAPPPLQQPQQYDGPPLNSNGVNVNNNQKMFPASTNLQQPPPVPLPQQPQQRVMQSGREGEGNSNGNLQWQGYQQPQIPPAATYQGNIAQFQSGSNREYEDQGSHIFNHKGNGLVADSDRYRYNGIHHSKYNSAAQYGDLPHNDYKYGNNAPNNYYNNGPYRQPPNWRPPQPPVQDMNAMTGLEDIAPHVNDENKMVPDGMRGGYNPPDYYYEDSQEGRFHAPHQHAAGHPMHSAQGEQENVADGATVAKAKDQQHHNPKFKTSLEAKMEADTSNTPKHSEDTQDTHINSSTEVTTAKIEAKKTSHKHNSHLKKTPKVEANIEVNMEETSLNEVSEEEPGRPSGAILSLALGLCITGIMVILIGCRLRVVRRRLRRGGKSPYAHDADYLVNGMYL